MGTNPDEVKLELKKPITGIHGIPYKDSTDMRKIMQDSPNLTSEEVQKRLPDLTFGIAIQNLLLNSPSNDAKEQVKVYRWVEKIESKMTTSKGEMLIDLNQLTELQEYIMKVKGVPTMQIAPIAIYLERLTDRLKETKQ
jgi:hypothetical protein